MCAYHGHGSFVIGLCTGSLSMCSSASPMRSRKPWFHCRRLSAAKATITATAASQGKRTQDDVMRPHRTLLRGHALPGMRPQITIAGCRGSCRPVETCHFTSSVHLSSSVMIERLLHNLKAYLGGIKTLLAVSTELCKVDRLVSRVDEREAQNIYKPSEAVGVIAQLLGLFRHTSCCFRPQCPQ